MHIIDDWKLKTFPMVRMETMNETFVEFLSVFSHTKFVKLY